MYFLQVETCQENVISKLADSKCLQFVLKREKLLQVNKFNIRL